MADLSAVYPAGVIAGLRGIGSATECPYGDAAITLRTEWLRGFATARPRKGGPPSSRGAA